VALLYQHRRLDECVTGSEARFAKAMRKRPRQTASVLVLVQSEHLGANDPDACFRAKR